MIGVIADAVDHDVVREFFELFKTPWEFWRSDQKYEVVLCAGDVQVENLAKLSVVYAGRKVNLDREQPVLIRPLGETGSILAYKASRLPIYGDIVTFPEKSSEILTDEDSNRSVAYLDRSRPSVLGRVGYDLFGEIRRLLTVGQPGVNAEHPALELHISLLRDLITGCGISLVEVPPIPEGYSFIACLTHDVDHPSIRLHKADHTIFGFLYRAVVGSLFNFFRGRIPVRILLKNWVAALKLPFVQIGLAKDFWSEFGTSYLKLEQGLCSTFFVIPFKDSPGMNSHGPAPKIRAARYGARDIAGAIGELTAAGCEIGLHGIDAWIDSFRGHKELDEIQQLTGVSETGVRMHWLYFDQQSPVALEKAGAGYDSTIGYNETVGYRAGTTQAYKPLPATRLLELPLHVMDTALFYPAHLGLSSRQAKALVAGIADNAVRLGGCLTVNWHDRSLAPERLWDASYCHLVQDLRNRGAWFATAGEAVSWFRKRRSVVFETNGTARDEVSARVTPGHHYLVPGLRLRLHKGRESHETDTVGSEGYVDLAFDDSANARFPCGVR